MSVSVGFYPVVRLCGCNSGWGSKWKGGPVIKSCTCRWMMTKVGGLSPVCGIKSC